MIDYAHNAMSLESLLSTLKEYGPERLVWSLDAATVPKLRRYGWVRYREDLQTLRSSHLITRDLKNPQAIIDDIKTGIEKTDGKYIEIIDRKEAIRYAIGAWKTGRCHSPCREKDIGDYQEIQKA